MRKLFLSLESIADDLTILSQDFDCSYDEVKGKKIIKEKYYSKIKEQIKIIKEATKILNEIEFDIASVENGLYDKVWK